MEFCEKLQQLRKDRGLTQEELAAALYVSRTAVSKWESGRGYPNIDSLKALAGFFGVTVDALLSGEEVLILAEKDRNRREKQGRDLVFGLLDVGAAALFFLPFFGQKSPETVRAVSLLALEAGASWLPGVYGAVTAAIVLCGLVTLALQGGSRAFWARWGQRVSLVLHGAGLLLFILSPQPYAAAYLLLCLAIKVFLLIKKP